MVARGAVFKPEPALPCAQRAAVAEPVDAMASKAIVPWGRVGSNPTRRMVPPEPPPSLLAAVPARPLARVNRVSVMLLLRTAVVDRGAG